MKCKVDKLDIVKLEITPFDSIKLSNVAKNDAIKKTKYNELLKKVNIINTTDVYDLVKKTDYNTKISEIEKKIIDHDYAKYITTQKCNTLTPSNFPTRLAQGNLVSKRFASSLLDPFPLSLAKFLV